MTKLNLSLRSISYNKRMSEETSCYSADLYLDGVRIAAVGNRGCGGCDEQRAIGGYDLDTLNMKIKATYPPREFMGKTFEQDLEYVCQALLNDYLTLKETRRNFAKKIVFVDGAEIRDLGWKTAMTPAMEATARAEVAKRYPNAIILNGLSDADILKHVDAAVAASAKQEA